MYKIIKRFILPEERDLYFLTPLIINKFCSNYNHLLQTRDNLSRTTYLKESNEKPLPAPIRKKPTKHKRYRETNNKNKPNIKKPNIRNILRTAAAKLNFLGVQKVSSAVAAAHRTTPLFKK